MSYSLLAWVTHCNKIELLQKKAVNFLHINPHHIELKCIACAFLDKSLTVVPLIYSGLYISLYFSYILLRLVKHPHPLSFNYITYNL